MLFRSRPRRSDRQPRSAGACRGVLARQLRRADRRPRRAGWRPGCDSPSGAEGANGPECANCERFRLMDVHIARHIALAMCTLIGPMPRNGASIRRNAVPDRIEGGHSAIGGRKRAVSPGKRLTPGPPPSARSPRRPGWLAGRAGWAAGGGGHVARRQCVPGCRGRRPGWLVGRGGLAAAARPHGAAPAHAERACRGGGRAGWSAGACWPPGQACLVGELAATTRTGWPPARARSAGRSAR